MKSSMLLARGLSSLVIFVAALELCARADDALSYGAPFWGPYSRQNLVTQDQFGTRGRPGGRYQKWQLNSLGYRGPELRSGTIRIVCIGASETFGLYEPAGQEYSRQLERDLDSEAGQAVFEVVNAAIAGEAVAGAILRVPELVDQIHPTFAIIYPSVGFYIWLPWVVNESVASSSRTADGKQTGVSLDLRLTERLRNLLKQALPSVVQTKLRQFRLERDIVEYHYPIMDRVPEQNVLRFREDLSELVAALRARGVEPVLVTHATAFGKQLQERDRDFLVEWRKFYPMLKEDGFLDMEQRMNDAIRHVAALEHVVLIDAANEIPPGRKYFADFSHFTSAGAEVMASRLAEGLQPLIAARLPRPSPVEQSGAPR